MATRDAYFFSNRAQATSARLNDNPAGWVGSADNIGSSTSTITTASDVTINGTSVTPFVHSNRRIKVTATATLTCAVASTEAAVVVVQGGTTIARIGRLSLASGGVAQFSGYVIVDNSAAGSTEFHLAASYISSSGSGTLAVANTSPAQARILIEDIGAAS